MADVYFYLVDVYKRGFVPGLTRWSYNDYNIGIVSKELYKSKVLFCAG
jgi:hypothetical protein